MGGLPGRVAAADGDGRRPGAATVGALLPATPLASTLGFHPLPGGFFAALAVMVACYLALIEVGKRLFYGAAAAPTGRRQCPWEVATCAVGPPTSAPATGA